MSAWYHIVYQGNSDTSTLANINKVYVNGVQLANANSSSLTPQNSATNIIRNGIPTYIGKDPDSNNYHFDGYLAEMHVIDGSIVAPTEFAETKDNVWIPKAYSGSYGNNGFYMTFQGTGTATTTAGDTAQINIGDDQSGNGRNFAVSGLASSDVVLDSPTNNFATLNLLSKGSGTITFSEGNLKSSTSANLAAAEHGATFTIPKSGKWYWEASYTGAYTNGAMATMMGIIDIGTQTVGLSGNHINNTTGEYVAYYSHNNGVYVSNTLNEYPSHISTQTSAVVGFALDMDNAHLWIHVNGTYINDTPDFSDGTNKIASPTVTKTFLPFFGGAGGAAFTWRANFGQDSEGISSSQSPDNGIGTFEYDVPADYKALCSANLPEPDIIDGTENFNTVLYTGNAGTQSITGVGFSPDWLWVKNRQTTYNHALVDSVRGATLSLSSNTTGVERTSDITSLDSNGFSLQFVTATGSFSENQGSQSYVSWNWLAGGTPTATNSAGAGATPTAGSVKIDGNNLGSALAGAIPATKLSANTTAGFSIVSYTGNGSADQTIAHGLSSPPELTIIKDRESNTNSNQWQIGSSVIGDDYVYFTSAKPAGTAGVFPTSGDATTLTVGRTGNNVKNTNESGDDFIMYNFHSVEGYSKVGLYEGNGSADGTFVFTGFRVALLLAKSIDSTSSWYLFDNKREGYNPDNDSLLAETTGAETTTDMVDLLSNGFKLRRGADPNIAETFVYLAIADQPFKYANAR